MEEVALDSLGPGLEAESKETSLLLLPDTAVRTNHSRH